MIIAFDTALKTGWAYQNSSGAWRIGVVNPRRTLALNGVIAEARDTGCRLAAIEDCYLGHGNVHTLKVLQDCQTRIQCACEAHGLAVRLVPAQEWQSDLGLTGTREDRKYGAMRIARMLTGSTKLTQDMADAVCIADYMSRLPGEESIHAVCRCL